MTTEINEGPSLKNAMSRPTFPRSPSKKWVYSSRRISKSCEQLEDEAKEKAKAEGKSEEKPEPGAQRNF